MHVQTLGVKSLLPQHAAQPPTHRCRHADAQTAPQRKYVLFRGSRWQRWHDIQGVDAEGRVFLVRLLRMWTLLRCSSFQHASLTMPYRRMGAIVCRRREICPFAQRQVQKHGSAGRSRPCPAAVSSLRVVTRRFVRVGSRERLLRMLAGSCGEDMDRACGAGAAAGPGLRRCSRQPMHCQGLMTCVKYGLSLCFLDGRIVITVSSTASELRVYVAARALVQCRG